MRWPLSRGERPKCRKYIHGRAHRDEMTGWRRAIAHLVRTTVLEFGRTDNARAKSFAHRLSALGGRRRR